MEKELGADIVKATQTSLGKYVKRPPLTEKLLRKPPFRFLHDIVSAVHKTTGFFEGLFEEDELISDNVKDRDSKILFLNKVISVIGLTTGKQLTVKSSKIVAGQEPEKTNELLQCLASALDKKLSSGEAVKKYKDSLKAPVSTDPDTKPKEKDTAKSVKKTTDTKKLNSKSSEKLTITKKEPGTVNKSNIVTKNEPKSKKKDTTVTKNEIPPKKPQQPKVKKAAVIASNETEPVADTKEKLIVIENETKINEDEHEGIAQLDVTLKTESKNNDYHSNPTTAKGYIIQSIAQESDGEHSSSNTAGVENELNSSLSSQDLMDIENADKSTINIEHTSAYNTKSDNSVNDKDAYFEKEIRTLPAKSIEPVLSRNVSTDSTDKNNELDKNKTIDKVVRKNSDIVRPPSVRPSSSRPGAPRLREKNDIVLSENDMPLLLAKVNIIAESLNNEEEEDKSIIIVEQHIGDESLIVSQQDQEQVQLVSNEHGHLVQQILDSQKEFSQVGKTEIEWQFGAQKIKEAVNQEIEQLRFNIQALSRVANPLGKLLDHIQEDAEVMRQELQQWTNVYDEVFKEMQKQKMANEETLVPLQTRIKQLDMDIQEKHDKIDDLKILIHKNTSRIDKLLINGNVQ